jgi:uncharacterized protein YjgD (DUF1641 family)
MAKPIRAIERKFPIAEELQTESLQEILKVLADNRQAIVAFLDVLNEVEAAGTFNIARGVLQNRSNLESIGLDFIKVAHIPSMLKNLILVMQFLGRLDPKQTEKLISGVGSGLEQAMREEQKPKNMWGLVSLMRDPDVMASMSTALHFLRGMGSELQKKEAENPNEPTF